MSTDRRPGTCLGNLQSGRPVVRTLKRLGIIHTRCESAGLGVERATAVRLVHRVLTLPAGVPRGRGNKEAQNVTAYVILYSRVIYKQYEANH